MDSNHHIEADRIDEEELLDIRKLPRGEDIQARAVELSWRWPPKWRVLRLGRPGGKIRLLLEAEAKARAVNKYRKVCDEMRQGLVALSNPRGEIVAVRTEPMVRTRW